MGSDVRGGLGIKSVDECSRDYKVSRAATDATLKAVSMKVSPLSSDIKGIGEMGLKGWAAADPVSAFTTAAGTAGDIGGMMT